jgi:hypothetical protein
VATPPLQCLTIDIAEAHEHRPVSRTMNHIHEIGSQPEPYHAHSKICC